MMLLRRGSKGHAGFIPIVYLIRYGGLLMELESRFTNLG